MTIIRYIVVTTCLSGEQKTTGKTIFSEQKNEQISVNQKKTKYNNNKKIVLFSVVLLIGVMVSLFFIQKKPEKRLFYSSILILCVFFLLIIFVFFFSRPRSLTNAEKLIEFCKKQKENQENNLDEIKIKEKINFDILFKKKKKNVTDCALVISGDYSLNIFDKNTGFHKVITAECFNPNSLEILSFFKNYDDITKTIIGLMWEKKNYLDYQQVFQKLIQRIKKDFPEKYIITREEFLSHYTKIFIVSSSDGISVFRATNEKDKFKFKTEYLYFLEGFLQTFNENMCLDKNYYYTYKFGESLDLHFKKKKKIKNYFEYSIISEEAIQNLGNTLKKHITKDIFLILDDKIISLKREAIEPCFFHMLKKRRQQIKFFKIKNLEKQGSICILDIIDNCFLTEEEVFSF